MRRVRAGMLVWLAVLGANLPCARVHAQARESAASDAPAAAPREPDERELFREAMRLFREQRYDEVLSILRALQATYGEPLYLFNLGQTYRELGDCSAAVAAYRRFLEAPMPDAGAQRQAARHSAQQYLLALEPCAATHAPSTPAAEPAPASRTALPAAARPAGASAEERATSSSARLWTSGLLFGVGAASAVAGTYWGVKAHSLETSLEQRYGGAVPARWDAQAEQDLADGDRYATLARWMGAAAALTLTAGSLVLLLMPHSGRRPRRDLAAVPGRHGAEVAWTTSF